MLDIRNAQEFQAAVMGSGISDVALGDILDSASAWYTIGENPRGAEGMFYFTGTKVLDQTSAFSALAKSTWGPIGFLKQHRSLQSHTNYEFAWNEIVLKSPKMVLSWTPPHIAPLPLGPGSFDGTYLWYPTYMGIVRFDINKGVAKIFRTPDQAVDVKTNATYIVAAFTSGSVKVYDKNFQFIQELPVYLNTPYHLAVTDNYIFLADGSNGYKDIVKIAFADFSSTTTNFSYAQYLAAHPTTPDTIIAAGYDGVKLINDTGTTNWPGSPGNTLFISVTDRILVAGDNTVILDLNGNLLYSQTKNYEIAATGDYKIDYRASLYDLSGNFIKNILYVNRADYLAATSDKIWIAADNIGIAEIDSATLSWTKLWPFPIEIIPRPDGMYMMTSIDVRKYTSPSEPPIWTIRPAVGIWPTSEGVYVIEVADSENLGDSSNYLFLVSPDTGVKIKYFGQTYAKVSKGKPSGLYVDGNVAYFLNSSNYPYYFDLSSGVRQEFYSGTFDGIVGPPLVSGYNVGIYRYGSATANISTGVFYQGAVSVGAPYFDENGNAIDNPSYFNTLASYLPIDNFLQFAFDVDAITVLMGGGTPTWGVATPYGFLKPYSEHLSPFDYLL